MSLGLLDVPSPFAVAAYWVNTQANHFGVALGKLGLKAGHVTELGGAYGCKVLRVGEQDCPTIADPLVKLNGPLRGFGCEIGRFFVNP